MPRRIFEGKVTSNKMENTVVVAIGISKRHPVYSKVVVSTKKLKAHDEKGAKINDIVRIEECRPYSKDVSFQVLEIIEEETK